MFTFHVNFNYIVHQVIFSVRDLSGLWIKTSREKSVLIIAIYYILLLTGEA